MKVEIFILRIAGGKSFFAQVEGRQMTVADAFCVLDSGPLPVCVGMSSLDVKIRFDQSEACPKQIRVTFMDENGRLALPAFDTTINVKVPKNEPTAAIPFAVQIKQLSLPAFGQYSIELAVDGQLAASTPLYVRQKA